MTTTTTPTTDKKTGGGLSDGVVSELATFWNVLPGHEDDLRAATERFADTLRSVPRDKNLHTGLRDQRHVIFAGGTQLMWATTFENDWDPYFEDFVQIGLHHFLDWMQHTTQYTHVATWLEESGGAEQFRLDNPDLEAQMKRSVPGLKAIVQSVRSPATGYFNNLREFTMPEIVKAQRVNEAFQQVLDDPAAEEALAHPALKPLLEEAAD
ncbi:MAG: hypothetical protein ACRDOZ_09935 [Nocardioides sp.]